MTERKLRFIHSQKKKASHDERNKQSKVSVQSKFVVGYSNLIPLESGAELSSLQDTATVMVAKERLTEKKQRNFLVDGGELVKAEERFGK